MVISELQQNFAFIGAGNMAQAIIRGLLAAGVKPSQICASNPGVEKRQRLQAELGIQLYTDNLKAAARADCVLLCVKPQKMPEVLTQLATQNMQHKLVISVAAGFAIDNIKAQLNSQRGVVRVMPNTPALIGEGASALYAEQKVSEADKALVETIFSAVGQCAWLESEQQIDVATAIAGSSPAYLFAMAEAMVEAASELGMPSQQARALSLQALRGAAMLAQSELRSLAELRQAVTSPGGTTAAALAKMQQHHFHQTMKEAVTAAYQRGRELAKAEPQKLKRENE